MKITVNDKAVDESVAAITADEAEGKTEVITDARDENVDEHVPFKVKLWHFAKSGVGKTVIGVLLLVIIVLAVPMTRYAFLGLAITKPTTITVVDATTGKPVSQATVHFGRIDGTTDSKGVATLPGLPVGDHDLTVEKKYYATASTDYLVPIFGKAATTVKLTATGRVASVTVTNAISGKPLSGATVTIGDTVATADDSGVASIALATKIADQTGTVTMQGFNPVAITVNTNDMAPQVSAKLVPNGNVFFLSNRTGSYDVMSAALDGSNIKVVLAGTGAEVGNELQLFPSADGSYVAYVARRGNDTQPNVYVITTTTGAVDKVAGSISPSAIGWIGNAFYFTEFNNNGGQLADKRAQLIAYSADSKQVAMVDASHLEDGSSQYNYAEQAFGYNFQLVGDRIYYAKCWGYSSYYGGNQNRQASMMAVVNGKAVPLKDVTQNGGAYCSTTATKPDAIYYRVMYNSDYHSDSYLYVPGKTVQPTTVTDAQLYNNNYQYLTSPSGKQTFWTETRDGNKVSFIGDASGQNSKQVSGADYTAYGWLGDDYVLYSKNGSELYVAAAGTPLDGAHKITNYFSARPQAG